MYHVLQCSYSTKLRSGGPGDEVRQVPRRGNQIRFPTFFFLVEHLFPIPKSSPLPGEVCQVLLVAIYCSQPARPLACPRARPPVRPPVRPSVRPFLLTWSVRAEKHGKFEGNCSNPMHVCFKRETCGYLIYKVMSIDAVNPKGLYNKPTMH